MQTFKVSNTLWIETGRVGGDGAPYLMLHQLDQSSVMIYLYEVKGLVAQLVEATIYLLGEANG